MSTNLASRNARIAVGVFLAVGLLCFAVHLHLRAEHLLQDGVRARAVVVELIERPQKQTYAPLYGYRDAAGREWKKRWHFVQGRAKFKIGDEREITYSPDDPEVAEFVISSQPAVMYAAIGVLLMGIGIAVARNPRTPSQATRPLPDDAPRSGRARRVRRGRKRARRN